jgi:hypothetical protein
MGAPAAALGDPSAGLVVALKPDVNRIGECVAHVVGQAGAGRLGDDHPQQVVADLVSEGAQLRQGPLDSSQVTRRAQLTLYDGGG